MATWNHRVVRHKISPRPVTGETEYFAIHEVHYNKKGEPCGMTVDSITIQGDCVEDLGWTLTKMMKCLENPVLDYDMEFANDDYGDEENDE